MRKYNPYKNIFYYYRGPSNKKSGEFDTQIEDNTTKALINTLENCSRYVVSAFMSDLGIEMAGSEKVFFDLQVAEEQSRPDALIQTGDFSIFVESKINAKLDKSQIGNHLKTQSLNYLICITPRETDVEIIKAIGDERLQFVTWRQIYLFFKTRLRRLKNPKDKFVVEQFMEYLEAINMTPFTGWQKRDFEAFLNIEDDPKKELRLRVKKKLNRYITDLRQQLQNDGAYTHLEADIGNIHQKDKHTWGVLCAHPKNRKIDKPHFTFELHPHEFRIEVNIEGIRPAKRMKRLIESDRDKFLSILKKLKGFNLYITKRFQIRVRKWDDTIKFRLSLGKDISSEDVEYILHKLGQYDYFRIICGKTFKTDDPLLGDDSFLQKSVGYMKQLHDFYLFSGGK